MDTMSKEIINSLAKHVTISDQLLDTFPHPLMLISKQRIVLNKNQLAEKMGVEAGKYCWDTFGQCASIPEQDKVVFDETGNPPLGGTRCIFCQADKALSSGSEQRKKVTAGGIVWDTYWVPTGHDTFLHFGIQISA